ncbi:MAG: nucleotidyltransferase family protein [Planctomycetota bacterium]
MPASPRLPAAVILAAGRSRRMGSPKPLLAWEGATVLGSIRQACADAGLSLVRIVLGPDAPVIVAGAGVDPREVVVNPTPDCGGQLASLQLAIRALAPLKPAAVMAWPVDHPGVLPATLRALVEGWRKGTHTIVRPVVGERGGHPTIFDASLFGELLLADPAQGARAVVRAHRDHDLRIPCDDPGAVRDLDTPEDYEAARGE